MQLSYSAPSAVRGRRGIFAFQGFAISQTAAVASTQTHCSHGSIQTDLCPNPVFRPCLDGRVMRANR